jgi:hypothetical protein
VEVRLDVVQQLGLALGQLQELGLLLEPELVLVLALEQR